MESEGARDGERKRTRISAEFPQSFRAIIPSFMSKRRSTKATQEKEDITLLPSASKTPKKRGPRKQSELNEEEKLAKRERDLERQKQLNLAQKQLLSGEKMSVHQIQNDDLAKAATTPSATSSLPKRTSCPVPSPSCPLSIT